MGRSAAAVFLVSFVLGVSAFIGTLLFGPEPRRPEPTPMTEAQRVEQERRLAGRAYAERRLRRIEQGEWGRLEQMAREVLALDPRHLWARTDLLHALANQGEDPGGVREEAQALLGVVRGGSWGEAEAWQAWAAAGWAHEFLGDPEAAQRAWAEAARLSVGPGVELAGARATEWYNRAGYLSLAGDADGAVLAWSRAVEEGYRDFGYARADYDYRALSCDPRFDAVAAEAARVDEARRAAYEEAMEAEALAGAEADRAARERGPEPPGP